MANFVQIYKSSDTNAPTLSGTAGSLINLLNKCLVTGYTTASVTSITRSGSVATVTIASNATLVTGNYVTISGAVETDYNGTFQITVNSATEFTYTVPNSPSTPATGTILYAKASLAWSSPFTDTNVAVYRSNDNSSNKFYLRIQETGVTAGGQKEAVATGYESMTSANFGSGRFPTTAQLPTNGGVIWYKSITADASTRVWSLIGDDKTFYLQIQNGTNTFMFGFGWFPSYRPGDGFNTFIGGNRTANTISANESNFGSTSNLANNPVNTGVFIARSHTQIGGSICSMQMPLSASFNGTYNSSPFNSGVSVGRTTWGPPFPNPPNMGFIMLPVVMYETVTGALRGRLPGWGHILCSANPYNNYETFTNVVGWENPNAQFVALYMDAYDPGASNWVGGKMCIDFVGPWS